MLIAVLCASALTCVVPILVSNKIDFTSNEVIRLFCTFKRLPFNTEIVVSNATGERFTRIEITFDSQSFKYYTTINSSYFTDVGWLQYNNERLLAFSPEKLNEGTDYVVDYGKIVYLGIYKMESVRSMVQIERIHHTEYFEVIVLENTMTLSILASSVVVLTCTLCCLPLIEYAIDKETKQGENKGEGKAENKGEQKDANS